MILDDLTSYASDFGSIYNQFKGGSNVATPAQVAPKQTMAPDNSRLLWIGAAVVAVVLAVVFLTRKRGK